MGKTVLKQQAKEKYTGLDYSSLISTAKEETKEQPEAKPVGKPEATKAPEGYKLVEKRTRRVQLVFQPSLYDKAEAEYKALGYKSFNDYVHSILEERLKEK